MLGWKSVCLFSLIPTFINHHHLVYRVNWLRAKARCDRWSEELQIVRHEMRWTILWFEHQMKEWKDRLDGSMKESKQGHIAYAEKQVAMWKMFIREGERGFKGMVVE